MSYNIKIKPSDRCLVERSGCDRYDHGIAACCGLLSGFIDVFFIGSPLDSKVGRVTDKAVDKFVISVAERIPKSLTGGKSWDPQNGKTVQSAIGFIERNFPVPYDQKNRLETGELVDITAKNHHFKSLGHSPSIIGLVFSILNQFTNTATFLDKGRLITIEGTGKGVCLQGANLCSKLYCGFCNWILHIISDMAGSSGSRGNGGRGSGVPIPMMELFGLCNFGKLRIGKNLNTLATTMTKVFQNGYDLRHGIGLTIPVMLEEMFIKLFWMIRRIFGDHKSLGESIPDSSDPDLRIMILTANSVLCAADTAGALVSGLKAGVKSTGAGVMEFMLNLNLVAWQRLLFLGFKELCIRVSPTFYLYVEEVGERLKKSYKKETALERSALQKYYIKMHSYNIKLDKELMRHTKEFEAEIQRRLNKTVSINTITDLDKYIRT